ncbi:hypothetical protein [Nocardioides sp. CER19]|uniref:hypothetical protein n=1 Tax=Nocardioides sp. CER19 TaxID=3038538 RepID=UPI00244BB13A|nr:hypothetical protein [Nocardioides sp. CER19]MDH2414192.1 hypothetical protein [Nocardioides sp. CER19]
MSGALVPIAWIVVAYSLLVTVAAAVGLFLRAPRPRWLDQLAWMLEVLAFVLAVGALAALSDGRPHELSTHLGYVAAVVVIVPIAMLSVRDDRGPWSSGVVAVAALATGVVAVRIMMTR